MKTKLFKDIARIILTILGATLAVLALAWLLYSPKCEPVAEASTYKTWQPPAIEPWAQEDWIDPMGESVQPEDSESEPDRFPNEKQMRLIGRLAEGMIKWKGYRDAGGWWHCGEWITDEGEKKDKALEVAYHIVRAADAVSDDPDKVVNPFVLNVWGMAGTAANESSFDPCTLGTNPRKWAYRKKMIKKRVRCISHTKEEILSVVTSNKAKRYFKNSGFDISLCQVLTNFYPNISPEETMTVERGADICAREMRTRAMRRDTDRPWAWWRGGRLQWYDDKVTRIARKLGAKPEEI